MRKARSVRLILDRRVPPPVEVDDMGRCRQVESGASCFERQHHERYAVVLLKALDQLLALPDERPTVEHEAAATEDPGQKVSQRPRHLAELCEHQRLVLPRGDGFAELAQPRELATVAGRVAPVAEPFGTDGCRFA